MKAIILNQPGSLSLIEKDFPKLNSENDALLKILKIGVCGTDLHAFSGKQPFFSYPRILGHELAVEVMETGKKVKNVKIGDKCTVMPYRNPYPDQAVLRGKPNCGEHLTVLGVHEDGGMQQYMTYPAEQLFSFPHIDTNNLAMIEPLAIGCHAVERARIQKEDIVMVVGAGPIGLSTAMFAQLSGARVIMMDINEDRLNFCCNNLKLSETVIAREDSKEQISKLLNGNWPTVILDATGNKESMNHTFQYAAAGGTIVFVGLFTGEVTFHDPLFHKKELTLKATRAALSTDFLRIGKLIEEGTIDPSFMITHRLPFHSVPELFSTLTAPENQVIKAIIDMDFID
ncbi:MAG: zinc-binding alcohol dehydrogenase family protein [Chitinophagaceae bacterium]